MPIINRNSWGIFDVLSLFSSSTASVKNTKMGCARSLGVRHNISDSDELVMLSCYYIKEKLNSIWVLVR